MKILLILKREYLTRVKKKSFIVMTIIGPILMAALMIAPGLLAKYDNQKIKTIAVIDDSMIFFKSLPNSKFIKFDYIEHQTIDKFQKNFENTDYYALLFIPKNILSSEKVQLFSNKQPGIDIKLHIINTLADNIEKIKLLKKNIDVDVLKSVKTDIKLDTIKWTDDGTTEKTSTEITMILSMVTGILIYFFIFLYGSQVMRGVIEEKTSRIIEVIISSVKPFKLMMGKILGIALVGLTQFVLWVILTFALVNISQMIFMPEPEYIQQEQSQSILSTEQSTNQNIGKNINMEEVKDMFSVAKTIDWVVILGSFLFYFIGGYLLYASLFAAVGAAVDSEADTHQFMMPITIPLILSIVMMQSIVTNPEGPIAFWGSIIPLTSPIIMMARIPFGVPYWQVILSIAILVITFLLTTKLAAKIYRTGILMYGKKVNYRELWKWLWYKN
ncbi:MAG: ABC transporter permease [Bacteroidetes bacterium]|nr:MAG: ABC transporter permease [Bacteroidota bacterium]